MQKQVKKTNEKLSTRKNSYYDYKIIPDSYYDKEFGHKITKKQTLCLRVYLDVLTQYFDNMTVELFKINH